jgi:valyl-tRNA synthetase
MDTQKYNGWTNYATWLVNLHFNCLDFTDDVESGVFDDMDADGIRCHVASWIQELVDSYLDEIVTTNNSFVLDIMNSTLQDVDWHDIADHYVDDIKDELNKRHMSVMTASGTWLTPA